jgi:ABC-type uncharacterized transport system fused permease/ATPase subunit
MEQVFSNALQMFDSAELFRQLSIFCIVVVFAISMSVYGLLPQPDAAGPLAALTRRKIHRDLVYD